MLESRYPFRAYYVLLITDFQKGQIPVLYQITSEPTQFFDYCNYIVNPASSLNISLNGTSPSGLNLHVPDLTTDGTLTINQVWLGIDSLDIAVSVGVKSVQEFYLNPSGTKLTPLSSGIATYNSVNPIYSYGSNYYPTIAVTNLNPSLSVSALAPNQGIQVWGYTYKLEALSAEDSKQYLNSGKFAAITLLPNNKVNS